MQWIILLSIFIGILSTNNSLPTLVREGDNCTSADTYKIDCNTCFCNNTQILCSKKDCFNSNTSNKSIILNKREEKNNRNIDDKEQIKDENLDKMRKQYEKTQDVKDGKTKRDWNQEKVLQTINEDIKRNHKSIDIQNITDNGKEVKMLKASGKFQKLNMDKKCIPGKIYSKGCRRCFCSHKNKIKCSKEHCDQMHGPVLVPTDVSPEFPRKKFLHLPMLRSDGDQCVHGKRYRVNCNLCLCLVTGELLCETRLCLRVSVLNEVVANNITGKPCNVSQIPPDECIFCTCEDKKFDCKPIPECTPLYYLRQLRGNPDPNRPYVADLESIPKKCIPNMSYSNSCNNCNCQKNGTLVCTDKVCLKHMDVLENVKNYNKPNSTTSANLKAVHTLRRCAVENEEPALN